MKITFYGAAGEVTGSKHLLATSAGSILFDCGMWQGGGRAESFERNSQFAFDPASITAVILSHAHLDHVGLLPRLVKQGFHGPIYATGATCDLTELILLDSAKLQEQDTAFAELHNFPNPELWQPLYTQLDIPPVMKLFRHVSYVHLGGDWLEILPGVRLKMYDAGHILGSALSVVAVQENSSTHHLLYTGDVGRKGAPLLRDPDAIPEPVHTLIMESTYGLRQHHDMKYVEVKLAEIIQHMMQQGSKIIVPAFSLGRTQELVYVLHRMTDAGQIPRFPIIIDSPLATKITEVYNQHQQDYDQESGRDFTTHGENPLAFTNLRFTESVEESKALNNEPGPMMIISASGMASGGRVMHHLRNHINNARNIILFTGYQAAGTTGRRLLDGAKELKIFHQVLPVRAQLATLNDLSAHADAHELCVYAQGLQDLNQIFLVHGEENRATDIAERLRLAMPNVSVTLPKAGETFPL